MSEDTKKGNIIMRKYFISMMGLLLVCLMLTGCGDANVSLVKDSNFSGHPKATIGAVMNRNFDDTDWNSVKEDGETKVKFTGTINSGAHKKALKIFSKSLSQKNAIALLGGEKLKERYLLYTKKIENLRKEKAAELKKRRERFKAGMGKKGISWHGDLEFEINKLEYERKTLQEEWDRVVSAIKYYQDDFKKNQKKTEKLKAELQVINKKIILQGHKKGSMYYEYDHPPKFKVQDALKNLSGKNKHLNGLIKQEQAKKKNPKLTQLEKTLKILKPELRKQYEIKFSYETKIRDLTQKANNEGNQEIYEDIKKNKIWPVGCKVELIWSIHSNKKDFELSNITGGNFKGLYNANSILSILVAK